MTQPLTRPSRYPPAAPLPQFTRNITDLPKPASKAHDSYFEGLGIANAYS